MAHDHNAHGHTAESHGTFKSYMVGFILSVILTVIPFGLVMFPTFSKGATLAIVVIMAVVQLLVHLYFFLHLNTSEEQRWNVISFGFTVVIVGIVVVGSLWIMYHMHNNMMIH
ncbi:MULTISPECIES: cytochrome o ubiquinol oxidase subunit IV [Pseudomonas]|jgi:cytochrome o ubiquinol oxidase operon protein cyoD|uniref:Cytochrome bo(3) ubiquinol oxidase subunit 4 n=2 Tax=Pseudomonas TaxID=286 RepID=A0A2Z5AEJ0_9PSED|nr:MULTISPECIES: cytochrome o ubiquinol oxidase subunit IV [Pseudomonas]AXA68559.1 cytochrome o ubiquinol oxidase subunit IV [Pseudomonas oryzihabitans]MDH4765988.1 cytochrome o ubiquinol oxidase subunit IV [Pseudomonas sp. CBMAI 2609]MDK8263864.1 cytochrome o ubiquinol oxidase subunit IV [Pseudomonas oryzihabitans]MDR6179729.1 cytochrome o ubiquinol oxidase operon protein cyoD [Pseudomonas sp. SORGH_AS_0211]MDR6231889.1 cytochrome o ubiquinol oxidase operon protein cyoD [Pseudomonas sp. SORGH